MKNLMLLVCLLLPASAWAQSKIETPWLQQGQMQVGIGLGAGWGDKLGGNVRLTPYAQYFIKNNWALRIEGRLGLNGVDTDQYLGGGLLTQYHFVHTSRLSIFGQAGYFYGQGSQGRSRVATEYPSTTTRYESNTIRYSYGMINVGLGAQYQVNKRWFLNVLAEKNLGKKVNGSRLDGHNISLGGGFRIK